MKSIFISFCFFILLVSCGADKEVADHTVPISNSNNANTLSIDLLIFKSEKELDVWQKAGNGQMNQVGSIQLSKRLNWPIGLFDWSIEDESSIHLVFPSSFYRKKLKIEAISNKRDSYHTELNEALSEKELNYLLSLLGNGSLGKLLILPNKPDKNGYLKPQLHGPHWSAELYALLELELKNYPTWQSKNQ